MRAKPNPMVEDFTHHPVTVEGKTAVVIGGTSGIGEAIALAFASDGADTVATSRSQDKVANTAAKIRSKGAETLEVTTDVNSREDIDKLRNKVLEEVGDIDILVTSASAISRMSVLKVSEEEWQHVLDVQLNGVHRATQSFAQVMETGCIIHVSSLAPQTALPNLSAYSAAKGGVDAYTRAAAKDLAPNIRVNAIAPGYVITEQTKDHIGEGTQARKQIQERCPMGDVADREEISGAAIYLASDAASYTTGEIITVDGLFGKSVF